jgi:hypothetical protein
MSSPSGLFVTTGDFLAAIKINHVIVTDYQKVRNIPISFEELATPISTPK